MPDENRIAVIQHFVSDLTTEEMAELTLEQWLEKHTTHDLISSIQSIVGENPDALDIDKVFKAMGLTPVPSLMASLLSAHFVCTGAVNYIEHTFESSILGDVVVTAQRKNGLTPAEKLQAAEKEISRLNKKLNKLNANYGDCE